MIVDALIPVRAAGKERLASVLTLEQRATLVHAMLTDVVTVLYRCALLRTVAVVSPDSGVLALAAGLGAVPIAEPPGAGGLNAALAAGLARLAAAGAEAVLILQGDLPQVRDRDMAALLSGLPAAPCVRAVPAADGGTSALLLCPPGVIAPAFGPESFARHQAAAQTAGAAFERLELPSLVWDIDRPGDLARLLEEAGGTHTARVLRAMRPRGPILTLEHADEGIGPHQEVRP